MSSIITAPSHAAFERTTTRWGSITLFIGFLIATSVPFYLLFVADANINFGEILKGFLAVFAVYGVFYIVEPLTYFPILGPAGMYQAFMIGNVSNKLLPSAIVAQDTIGAKPGTRKGEYAATMAICGAAIVVAAVLSSEAQWLSGRASRRPPTCASRHSGRGRRAPRAGAAWTRRRGAG